MQGIKKGNFYGLKIFFFKLITTSMNHLYLLFVDLFAANLIAWFQVTLEQSFKGSFWLIFTLFSIVRYVIDFSWHRSNFFNLINLWHGTTAVITHQHNSGGSMTDNKLYSKLGIHLALILSINFPSKCWSSVAKHSLEW